MRKSLLITAFLFATGLQTVYAQVPGYQGKRFSLGYNASSFFYVTNFGNGDGILGIIGSTKLSYKTELSANYTVSRKVTMGFSYYAAKQNYYFRETQIINYGYAIPSKGIAQCKLAIYELHFQFYRKNFVAPTGLYHQLSLGIVKYGLASKDNKLTVYSNGSSYPIVLDGPASPYSCVKLGYAIGKTNPVGHNFYINTAFGINFFRSGDAPILLSGGSSTPPTAQNYIKSNFNWGLRVHNFAEIKLGLGWLAF